ncbi:MAG: aldolase catalytic domain-containing protein [Lachnospiraceae bacterium]|nr:aldolase catalytic domain-containing protein [Lachnospiraceae bacterium]
MSNFKILDCTLRDGGYVNDWNFGKKTVVKVLCGLANAGIDIVEIGFLSECQYDKNKTVFNSISQIDELLPNQSSCKYVLMIALGEKEIACENVPLRNGGPIWGIRLTFHKNEIKRAFEYASDLMDKGYVVFMQPIGTVAYKEDEFLHLIEKINCLKPYAFSIVDTLGNITANELIRLFRMADKNLVEGIRIGFHAHNNLQLAFSNAQELINEHSDREVIIDSSIIGMGRGAGNLCTELIARYMNTKLKSNYNVTALLEVIDKYLISIQTEFTWGYSVPYYISAVNNCHPNYATYLMNLQTVNVSDIEKVIGMIPVEERTVFNKKCIENLYKEYQSHYVDDKETVFKLKGMFKDKNMLILAPGRTLVTESEKIYKYIEEKKPYIISINFVNEEYPINAVFISNLKRFDLMEFDVEEEKELIITSNIDVAFSRQAHKINYLDYLCSDSRIADNSGMMLMSLLRKCGIKNVVLAGFDGFKASYRDDYFERGFNLNVETDALLTKTRLIGEQIEMFGKDMNIQFLTTSQYAKN